MTTHDSTRPQPDVINNGPVWIDGQEVMLLLKIRPSSLKRHRRNKLFETTRLTEKGKIYYNKTAILKRLDGGGFL